MVPQMIEHPGPDPCSCRKSRSLRCDVRYLSLVDVNVLYEVARRCSLTLKVRGKVEFGAGGG